MTGLSQAGWVYAIAFLLGIVIVGIFIFFYIRIRNKFLEGMASNVFLGARDKGRRHLWKGGNR